MINSYSPHEVDGVQQKALRLLNLYFDLMNVAFGNPLLLDRAEDKGWSTHSYAQFIRRISNGCHNLPELISNPDSAALLNICQHIYQNMSYVTYPALWQNGDAGFAWKQFCDEVASIVEMEPRYGESAD